MARTPLHTRIAADLRGRIHDRELTPGDLLPSESELQERFSVSRSVVRQALATLESEGLVRRARGRGTVVAPRAEMHRDVDLSSGLMAQLQQRGARTSTRVLRLEPASAPGHVSELGDEVWVLERLRSVDDLPAAFIRTHLPAEVASGLDREALTHGSLHQLVTETTGRRIADGRRTIRAVAAAPPLDAALAVAPGTPLLLLEGTSTDQEGRPVEVFSTWHRSDLIAFDLTLQPTVPGVPSGPAVGSPGSATPAVRTDVAGAARVPMGGSLAERVERATALAEEALSELRTIRTRL
ncbi:GntR family transcriptional regulator [Streptomyces sp. XM4193]|uniref:GntR family transcriptional regulator n=1 Tax=Streptomyces sp. XM4193 TaxID=2929782 RepID=UPI001FFBA493|nr:GntR family transcriptional regulator [Streptomyces sp. XM4193]MCK1798043.1 GntR family transcriptional regulator [Streptomyces sp. XM4193]